MLSLEHAGTAKATPEQRGALYLQAAREASALVGSPTSGVAARSIYNKAAADLTLLLRSSENEALRNRPLAITTGNTVCHLRFAKGSRDGVRDPAYFTPFTPAAEVGLKTIDRRNLQDGIGGALVGIRKSRSYGKA